MTCDPERVSIAEIYQAVDDAGYHAIRESVSIGITDMSCANYAKTDQQALKRIPGIIRAEVNFTTDEAQIEYNPQRPRSTHCTR